MMCDIHTLTHAMHVFGRILKELDRDGCGYLDLLEANFPSRD